MAIADESFEMMRSKMLDCFKETLKPRTNLILGRREKALRDLIRDIQWTKQRLEACDESRSEQAQTIIEQCLRNTGNDLDQGIFGNEGMYFYMSLYEKDKLG
mmetsp:Transcript_2523/g.3504  ORF Transcript_2523/g.3504 Transcript_2523/m.3504 type:complete len:102 (+) Transcript_2523:125-430(+)